MRFNLRYLHGLAVAKLGAGFMACSLLLPPPTETVAPSATVPPTFVPTGTVTEYYVAPDGSDDNDGSRNAPWATLQHAVDRAQPADTILVHEGRYAGMRIERSGTPEGWITLRAAEGESVVINGPGPANKHDSNVEVETWQGSGTVAYWIIEGFEVVGAPSWGIDVRGNEEAHSHHIVIRNNLVHENGLDTGRTGIFTAFADNVTIADNHSFRNGEHGIYLSNSGDDFRVVGNRLSGNVFCGLHLNGDESQGGDGIISDGLIEANIIYGNGGEGCSGINLDGVTDTTLRNNLLYGNLSGGISLFQENGAICSKSNRLLHNTIVMPEDGRWAVNISDADCINNQLFNNIVLTSHERRGSILLPTAEVEGFESDHNLVMDRFSADDGNSVITIGAWRQLGYDRNSSLATIEGLFRNPANGDYRPRLGSPAVDGGLPLPDVFVDLIGTERPQGAGPDIGAYEVGAPSSEGHYAPTPGG